MVFEVKNFEDWEKVIEEIVPKIKYKILLLKGDLGAGKTTFTKLLMEHLGSDDEVNSPTYALVNEYQCNFGKVFHFDLYRVNDIEELYDMGIEEYLETGYLSIIEWPEIYENELEGMEYHCIRIEADEKGKRNIQME